MKYTVTPGRPGTSLAKIIQERQLQKLDKVFREWRHFASKTVPGNIIKSLEKGVSPVKGKGRFLGYSDSYFDAIQAGRYQRFGKNTRPVNLKLSGKLYKSLKVTKTKTGFIVKFTRKVGKWNLAEIHTKYGPGGKSEYIRPMLPQDGERLSDSIMRESNKLLRMLMKRAFK